MRHCESYIARGHKYLTSYDLWSIENTNSEDHLLDLIIHAIAPKDVFILLTPTSQATNETFYLEFGKLL